MGAFAEEQLVGNDTGAMSGMLGDSGLHVNVEIIVETTVAVLIEKERQVRGNPGYITKKDKVTISPVYRALVPPAFRPPCCRIIS